MLAISLFLFLFYVFFSQDNKVNIFFFSAFSQDFKNTACASLHTAAYPQQQLWMPYQDPAGLEDCRASLECDFRTLSSALWCFLDLCVLCYLATEYSPDPELRHSLWHKFLNIYVVNKANPAEALGATSQLVQLSIFLLIPATVNLQRQRLRLRELSANVIC